MNTIVVWLLISTLTAGSNAGLSTVLATAPSEEACFKAKKKLEEAQAEYNKSGDTLRRAITCSDVEVVDLARPTPLLNTPNPLKKTP